jgi:hypothetical protein
MNLYLDRLPEQDREFHKMAAFAARLSEQAENWPQEMTSELFKQLPFLSDYDVNVNLDRVEPSRGFAFGYADVSSKSERPEEEHEESGIPHIRIPLIVVERSVKPFSVFLEGETVLPLSEDRVRQILFNPATFDLSSAQPQDPSLVEGLMPPTRGGFAGGGEYKTASARVPSILQAIAPTLSERDVARFVEKVASDPTLQAGFKRSGITPILVDVFDNTKRASADDRLLALHSRIEPSVVTFQRLPGGEFLVKSANVDAFAEGPDVAGQVLPEEDVEQAIGPENAQAMQPGQTATAVSNPIELAASPETKAKMIDEFGQYKVQDEMGNSLIGHVFPKLLMWDGDFTPQDMALFTNGSAYALHDTAVGEFVGKGTNLPSDTPRGDGVFYAVHGGEAVCTAPVTIGSSAAGPDGLPRFAGTDIFGTPVQISQQEGIKSPMRISDSEYVLPSDWKFMRLNNQTQIVTDPTQMNKMASVRSEKNSVTMFYNCGYHFQGGCGLDKISSDLRYDLDQVGAEFLLGVLGVDGVTAKTKVAEARKKGSIKLAGLKTITLLSERYSQAEKTASALYSKVPNLRRDLVKEAASLPDAGTVDNVLALNFINPENIITFVSYVPQFEETTEKLAEMLLYAYLGMKDIPEGAVERSMRNLEEVIAALKALQHSMSGEEEARQ